jgi:hypothetical protein
MIAYQLLSKDKLKSEFLMDKMKIVLGLGAAAITASAIGDGLVNGLASGLSTFGILVGVVALAWWLFE